MPPQLCNHHQNRTNGGENLADMLGGRGDVGVTNGGVAMQGA